MGKSRKKIKVCLICAAGGHFEQIRQLKDIINNYDCYFMVNKTKATAAFKGKRHIIAIPLTKNKFFFYLSYIYLFLQQLFFFALEWPDVVITTGSGFVIPTCMYAKIFKKKLIYIETFAKINSPSETGKFIYNKKMADLFIVQHDKCLQYFPDAVMGGWIY